MKWTCPYCRIEGDGTALPGWLCSAGHKGIKANHCGRGAIYGCLSCSAGWCTQHYGQGTSPSIVPKEVFFPDGILLPTRPAGPVTCTCDMNMILTRCTALVNGKCAHCGGA